MNRKRRGFHTSHMNSLGQDLSRYTIIFDLVLTLKFDLLFKNFNLGHNLWTVRDMALIVLHMCIPCDKTFHFIP